MHMSCTWIIPLSTYSDAYTDIIWLVQDNEIEKCLRRCVFEWESSSVVLVGSASQLTKHSSRMQGWRLPKRVFITDCYQHMAKQCLSTLTSRRNPHKDPEDQRVPLDADISSITAILLWLTKREDSCDIDIRYSVTCYWPHESAPTVRCYSRD